MQKGAHREQLFGKTQVLLLELADDAAEAAINRWLDARVRGDPALDYLATQAGGRWQVAGGGLVFAAW